MPDNLHSADSPLAINKRHIVLSGSKNFRDFGAYPTQDGRIVKSGILFRSDRLSDLSPHDLEILKPLAIRTIFDLRGIRERENALTRWHENAFTRNVHMPLISESGGNPVSSALRTPNAINDSGVRQAMMDLYRDMVSQPDSLNCLRHIFQSLTCPGELPVLVHCSGGKDRTGVTCALILWCLGVERSIIEEDYLLSKVLYSDRIDVTKSIPQALHHQKDARWSEAAIRTIFSVEAAFLDSAFEHVLMRFGSAERFVEQALKLDSEQLAQIRHNLVEKP